MAVVKWAFTVEMDDGAEHNIVADQRDLSEWEDEPFGLPFTEIDRRKPVVFARYLAWSAMVRDGLFPCRDDNRAASWKAFKRACREVRETEAQAGDQVDPGKAAPPDAP